MQDVRKLRHDVLNQLTIAQCLFGLSERRELTEHEKEELKRSLNAIKECFDGKEERAA